MKTKFATAFTVLAWLGNWWLILWINFAAELSLLMHLVAIPVLLLSTAFGVGKLLEQRQARPRRTFSVKSQAQPTPARVQLNTRAHPQH
ncbi:hypothetical protein H1D31_11220 [Alishewanella sp. BS5-314]|uniref:hypothetical protein n=1 Tax=Alishewanella sp. BS5-314 TaxID=2755587 RepID=UPI0021BB9B2F|nr:hypothetical protein [Alishewanella sp. BS5-314]MCT8126584.1 hypothetical protein [Alishewanella sp. BS5-314]